jgi:hypothetical protein
LGSRNSALRTNHKTELQKKKEGNHENSNKSGNDSGGFMRANTKKHFVLFSLSIGLLLSASLGGAQVGTRGKLPGGRAVSSAAQLEKHQAMTQPSSSFNFTLLNYPGTLATSLQAINKGATTSKVELVGGYGTETSSGFLARVSGTKSLIETYQTVNVPHGIQTFALGVNDLGNIVGQYQDSSGIWHGYEESAGKFTEINVPFAGTTGTFAVSMNNSGEIVGLYNLGSGGGYGFTLIAGTYTSINYPGATTATASDINNNGDIVGQYSDTTGTVHGYLLSGGTYTSIDFPGATWTTAYGINDAGDIVGSYCTTSGCVSTEEGMQGFLLSGGTFTTIAVPNEPVTAATAINNAGVIVGFYEDAAGVIEGFMATP